MSQLPSATPPTVVLLFDNCSAGLELRWQNAVNTWGAQDRRIPISVDFNQHLHINTQFKHILCDIKLPTVAAGLTFTIEVPSPNWSLDVAHRNRFFANLLHCIDTLNPSHIWWLPAGIVTSSDYFKNGFRRHLIADHAFPMLACIDFTEIGDVIVKSRGLSWFAGQEIKFYRGPLTMRDSMRIILRIAHDIIMNGPFLECTRIAGLAPGEHFELNPEAVERELRVSHVVSKFGSCLS